MFGLKKQNTDGVPDDFLETERIYQEGMATVRDLIAPASLRVSPQYLQIGETFVRTWFVMTFPRYLNTSWFAPIINLDLSFDVAMFIHPIETTKILKDLRKSATHVISQIEIEARAGKISDPVLETAQQDIEDLRFKLQQGTEKFFRFGMYVTVYGNSLDEVNKFSKQISEILEAQMVYVKPAVMQAIQGMESTLPLGVDELNVGNNLNTAPLATTFPFVSSSLSSDEGILYGINRHNSSLIIFDRFKMENANMVVFAKSGAGKSYTVKLEVFRSIMMGTQVIIIDPENEYKYLCETLGGTYIKIALNSDSHINPFDLPHGMKDEDPEDIFRSHVANLIGLLHLMLGAVTPEEDSVLDRALRETYAIRDVTPHSNFETLKPEDYPTMADLFQVLRNMEGAESLSVRLEKYTEGIFSGFISQPTNINTQNIITVFNIRDLEDQLRPIAMYMVLQYIWKEMRTNLTRRMVVVDEAWIMMQNEDAASFMFGIAKRCRKYYTGLSTITQDINDFVSSRYGKPIITNSSIQLLLKQSPSSIEIIGETFYLTDHEKMILRECSVGEGIFIVGPKRAAIKVVASYSEDQVITSDPKQLLEIEEAKKELENENF